MQQVMICGAGFMGAGIAQVCAQSGYRVSLNDTAAEAVDVARRTIAWSLNKMAAKGLLAEHPPAVLDRIRFARDRRDTPAADWIIEAVTEDEEVKLALFDDLDRLASPDAIIATNTSSIPVTRLAKNLRHPGRVLGLHFFGPVPLMKLVEVIRGEQTSGAVFERGVQFVASLDKTAIRVNRDIPGFIVNRVFAAAFRESLKLVEAGVATVEDVDAGMRLGFGWSPGPFEIADNAGLDTFLRVSRSLAAQGESHLASESDHLEKLVAAGRLGRKTGGGFYSYGEDGRKKTKPQTDPRRKGDTGV